MKKNIVNYIKRLFYILIFAMITSYLSFYMLLVFPAMRRTQEEKHLSEIQEVHSTMKHKLDEPFFFAKDNAEWDSLYDILKNPEISEEEREFLKKTFSKDTLNLYGLDYIGVFTTDQKEVIRTSNPTIDISHLFQQKRREYFFSTQPNGRNRVKVTSGYTQVDGRAYMFLSHVVLDNLGGGEAAGYLLLLKEISQKDIIELEIERNLTLELYIPSEDDTPLIRDILRSRKNGSYYFKQGRHGTKTYYIPYFEGKNEVAYAIKMLVDDSISLVVLLGLCTGMIPILILAVFIFYIKKKIHLKLIDPIISLYNHIVSIKETTEYLPLKYPEVENEVDKVIEAFNHLMITVRDQKADIEDQKAMLEELAYTDHLTGLATRRLLDTKYSLLFESAKRSESTLTLIMMDIDYFKKYNDVYGHQAGDHVLRSVGDLMRSVFRREGDIVSRYGGEEFLIVLFKTPLEDVITLVERFQEGLEELGIEHSSSPFKKLTVSIGIRSQKILKDQDPHLLFRETDECLYRAKNQGRNRYVI